MIEIPSPDQIIHGADRGGRPAVAVACTVVLFVALLVLLVVPVASASGGSSNDDGQTAEGPLFP